MAVAWYKRLYVQVFAAILVGIVFGAVSPAHAAQMRPLGDGFIKLVKMLIAPIVFTTVAVGIARMGAMRDVGRIGLRALAYFEVVSTVALVCGMVVVAVWKPGSGLRIDANAVDLKAIAQYTSGGAKLGAVDFVLNVIPNTVIDAFARGEILQVLCVSVLFGLALLRIGPRVRGLVAILEQLSEALFDIVDMVMWLAPIGSFGAMAFTVGRYGIAALLPLAKLVSGVYATSALFVLLVLGLIARVAGIRILSLLRYIRDEIFIVLGTASSESVLPSLMEKLERLGCPKSVVGLVIPTGYSFNLDGTSIYMTMAVIFMAQVSGVHLSFGQELSILAILLLTSKGAAAVTGSGFITLAATLTAVPAIPVFGLALLLGVDRFLSSARAITNLIGNAVATVVIARWDGQLDLSVVNRNLAMQATELPTNQGFGIPDPASESNAPV
ncbi:MAG TPA: C4-dicarboxylate transporter DctA [Vicinamibacterales bacterium]|nr:C4-dicarboxylate transporter DctA [Vicinamibacterales bacterium]